MIFWRGLLFSFGAALLIITGSVAVMRREAPQPHYRVLAENTGSNEYYLYRERLDDGKRWQITPLPAREYRSPTLSPDGQWIAVVSYNLHLIHISGQPTFALTDSLDGSATWSPDGEWLAFQSYRDSNWDIYRLHLRTRTLERLTDDPADDISPAWSPDGQWIAFLSLRDDDTWNVFRMNADGSEEKNLTHADHHVFNPTWSPDGALLGFYYNSISIKKITHTMNPDGTSWILLFDDPAKEWEVARLPVIDAPLHSAVLLLVGVIICGVGGYGIYREAKR